MNERVCVGDAQSATMSPLYSSRFEQTTALTYVEQTSLAHVSALTGGAFGSGLALMHAPARGCVTSRQSDDNAKIGTAAR